MLRRIVALVGPTASGKSAAALQLAQRLGGAIVGADSVQVYRGFDIGSAKPSLDERQAAPHALIDVVAPDEDFTAAHYAQLADEAIVRFSEAGRLPLVVGGTGLYFRALTEGLMEVAGKDEAIRQTLNQLSEADLRNQLREIDPQREAAINARDRFRLVRALEIAAVSGRPPSAWAEQQRRESRYDVLWLGVSPPRPLLYERIDERVNCMWSQGWLDEVRGLVEQGYGESRAMRSVGYAEVYAHLYEGVPLAEAQARARQRTRRYAKRQLTWFRANPAIYWSDSSQPDNVDRLYQRIEEWLA